MPGLAGVSLAGGHVAGGHVAGLGGLGSVGTHHGQIAVAQGGGRFFHLPYKYLKAMLQNSFFIHLHSLKFLHLPVFHEGFCKEIWISMSDFKNIIYFNIPIEESLSRTLWEKKNAMNTLAPPGWLSGGHVGFMIWWLWAQTRLRRNFFAVYFRLSPLLKHVRKVVGGFGKKFMLILVWESQETHASPTAMVWP